MSETKKEVKVREATSIKIKPDVWKEAKIEAIREGKTVSEFIEEAIEARIAQSQTSKTEADRIASKYTNHEA